MVQWACQSSYGPTLPGGTRAARATCPRSRTDDFRARARLADHLGANPTVAGLIPQVGSILSGARSFWGDDPHRGTENEGEAFSGGWEGQQFVLTHHPPAEPVPGVTFAGDLHTAVTAVKAAAGDGHVNVIGADVARQCIEADLVDELRVVR
jgi:hypothetical protein